MSGGPMSMQTASGVSLGGWRKEGKAHRNNAREERFLNMSFHGSQKKVTMFRIYL